MLILLPHETKHEFHTPMKLQNNPSKKDHKKDRCILYRNRAFYGVLKIHWLPK